MDRYERVKVIGRGNFGVATLMKRRSDGALVVMKRIDVAEMPQSDRVDATHEVSLLATLKHPNIVGYHESFVHEGSLYIVMDYAEGGDLAGRIRRARDSGDRFSESQILDWFVQIASALAHVHGRSIMHRDIKTQNVFLTRHGIVKMGDFGIAKVLSTHSDMASTVIGTPYYYSPELCNDQPYNHKSDVWALGCVLYEMATLSRAFEGGNIYALALKILSGKYPPLPSHYSADLRRLVDLMLQQNPNDRPEVSQLLADPFVSAHLRSFEERTRLRIHTALTHQVEQRRPPHPSSVPRHDSGVSALLAPSDSEGGDAADGLDEGEHGGERGVRGAASALTPNVPFALKTPNAAPPGHRGTPGSGSGSGGSGSHPALHLPPPPAPEAQGSVPGSAGASTGAGAAARLPTLEELAVASPRVGSDSPASDEPAAAAVPAVSGGPMSSPDDAVRRHDTLLDSSLKALQLEAGPVDVSGGKADLFADALALREYMQSALDHLPAASTDEGEDGDDEDGEAPLGADEDRNTGEEEESEGLEATRPSAGRRGSHRSSLLSSSGSTTSGTSATDDGGDAGVAPLPSAEALEAEGAEGDSVYRTAAAAAVAAISAIVGDEDGSQKPRDARREQRIAEAVARRRARQQGASAEGVGAGAGLPVVNVTLEDLAGTDSRPAGEAAPTGAEATVRRRASDADMQQAWLHTLAPSPREEGAEAAAGAAARAGEGGESESPLAAVMRRRLSRRQPSSPQRSPASEPASTPRSGGSAAQGPAGQPTTGDGAPAGSRRASASSQSSPSRAPPPAPPAQRRGDPRSQPAARSRVARRRGSSGGDKSREGARPRPRPSERDKVPDPAAAAARSARWASQPYALSQEEAARIRRHRALQAQRRAEAVRAQKAHERAMRARVAGARARVPPGGGQSLFAAHDPEAATSPQRPQTAEQARPAPRGERQKGLTRARSSSGSASQRSSARRSGEGGTPPWRRRVRKGGTPAAELPVEIHVPPEFEAAFRARNEWVDAGPATAEGGSGSRPAAATTAATSTSADADGAGYTPRRAGGDSHDGYEGYNYGGGEDEDDDALEEAAESAEVLRGLSEAADASEASGATAIRLAARPTQEARNREKTALEEIVCSNIGRDKYEELRQRLSQLAESDAEVVDEGDLRELLDDPVTVEQVPRVFRILSLS